MLEETLCQPGLGEIVHRHCCDTLARRVQQTASFDGVLALDHHYAYDAVTMMKTVSDTTHTSIYDYEDNFCLVRGIAFSGQNCFVLRAKKHSARLNRLSQTTTTNLLQVGNVASFYYQYNRPKQQIQAAEADGGYWKYHYDDLGQFFLRQKV